MPLLLLMPLGVCRKRLDAYTLEARVEVYKASSWPLFVDPEPIY